MAKDCSLTTEFFWITTSTPLLRTQGFSRGVVSSTLFHTKRLFYNISNEHFFHASDANEGATFHH
ncbi:MAG: hypothetical protein UZ07_CHB004001098 [Chlorobi bacterium OLB7]|nr:MAG: hypothetical protein UZ07_CHB004001098 [Chlorobi bacterium OLB7]